MNAHDSYSNQWHVITHTGEVHKVSYVRSKTGRSSRMECSVCGALTNWSVGSHHNQYHAENIQHFHYAELDAEYGTQRRSEPRTYVRNIDEAYDLADEEYALRVVKSLMEQRYAQERQAVQTRQCQWYAPGVDASVYMVEDDVHAEPVSLVKPDEIIVEAWARHAANDPWNPGKISTFLAETALTLRRPRAGAHRTRLNRNLGQFIRAN